MAVKLQAQDDAEARSQRRREQSGARSGADEGERLHIHGVGAGGGALSDDDVEFVVFERGVEEFLERRLEAMDFVDEQDLFVADVGQYCSQVALDLQRRAGGLLKRYAEFVGDDCG